MENIKISQYVQQIEQRATLRQTALMNTATATTDANLRQKSQFATIEPQKQQHKACNKMFGIRKPEHCK